MQPAPVSPRDRWTIPGGRDVRLTCHNLLDAERGLLGGGGLVGGLLQRAGGRVLLRQADVAPLQDLVVLLSLAQLHAGLLPPPAQLVRVLAAVLEVAHARGRAAVVGRHSGSSARDRRRHGQHQGSSSSP